MSMQPCLPVPRKRARKETSIPAAAAAAAVSDACSTGDHTNCTRLLFDNVQEMDASEYLRRVVEQAEQIPEIMIMSSSSSSAAAETESSSQGRIHVLSQTEERRRHSSNVNKKRKEITTDHGVSDITRIIMPIQGSAASLHYLVSHRTSLQPPPTARHAASRAWVDYVLENFSRLRSYLDTCIQDKGVGQERQHAVPALKDRPGWLVFCIGQDEADGNVGSYFDDDDDDVGVEDQMEENKEKTLAATSTTATNQLVEQQKTGIGDDKSQQQRQDIIPLWKQNLPSTGYTPTVELVGQMDQVMIRQVLRHLIHYITQGWSLQSKALTCWIYALLARLERPLHRDEACLLYQLLKQMTQDRIKIRSVDLLICSSSSSRDGGMSRYDTELAHLNLLISIVGIYFEQGGGYDAVMRYTG